MSDPLPPPDAPSETAPQPPAAPTVANLFTTSECPGCKAKVRNISVQPGEKIRCLNCGMRFAPIAAASVPVSAAAPSTTPAAPALVREPQSAGYWIIRVPAMIAAIASVIVFAILVYGGVSDFYTYHRSSSSRMLEDLQPLFYMPLLPLAGYLLFRITRALAHVEAGSVKAAWKRGLLRAPLPAAPGSSLPYIVPLAVGPVVMVIAMAVGEFNRNRSNADAILPAVLLVPLFFLAGFICDDLRHFLWRQQALAGNCAKNSEPPAPLTRPAFPMLGALLFAACCAGAGTAISALFIEYRNNEEWTQRHDYDEYKLYALLSATLIGVAFTLFLMGRNFYRAVEAWQHARLCIPGQPITPRPRKPDIPALLIRCLLYAFIITGVVTVVSDFVYNNGVKGALEVAGVSFAMSAGVFLCLALARFYSNVRQWRKAQVQFWRARGDLPHKPVLSRFPRVIIVAAVLLVLLQTFVFLSINMESWNKPWVTWQNFITEVVMVAFIAHFPTIYVALIAREFMLAESAAMQLTAPTPER